MSDPMDDTRYHIELLATNGLGYHRMPDDAPRFSDVDLQVHLALMDYRTGAASRPSPEEICAYIDLRNRLAKRELNEPWMAWPETPQEVQEMAYPKEKQAPARKKAETSLGTNGLGFLRGPVPELPSYSHYFQEDFQEDIPRDIPDSLSKPQKPPENSPGNYWMKASHGLKNILNDILNAESPIVKWNHYNEIFAEKLRNLQKSTQVKPYDDDSGGNESK